MVIADNGSTDGTLEFARDWSQSHPNFLVVDASGLPGRRRPATPASDVSSGEFLAFCDADDVVMAGWLEAVRPPCGAPTSSPAGSTSGASTPSRRRRPCGPPPASSASSRPASGRTWPCGGTPFLEVGGFDEQLVPGEDIDLCWRLQLRGFTYLEAADAVVAKRARPDFRGAFQQAYAYGKCGPLLHKRFRRAGAQRDLEGALAKAWVWLVVSVFRVAEPTRRIEWARGAGTRLGRLEASLRLRSSSPEPRPPARCGAQPTFQSAPT